MIIRTQPSCQCHKLKHNYSIGYSVYMDVLCKSTHTEQETVKMVADYDAKKADMLERTRLVYLICLCIEQFLYLIIIAS